MWYVFDWKLNQFHNSSNFSSSTGLSPLRGVIQSDGYDNYLINKIIFRLNLPLAEQPCKFPSLSYFLLNGYFLSPFSLFSAPPPHRPSHLLISPLTTHTLLTRAGRSKSDLLLLLYLSSSLSRFGCWKSPHRQRRSSPALMLTVSFLLFFSVATQLLSSFLFTNPSIPTSSYLIKRSFVHLRVHKRV